MSELPRLTPEEKHAIDSLDMIAILGTWKEQYENAHDVAIKYMRKCREQQAEIERLRADLQVVTKSRDHYMTEFNRFDKGYWAVVEERNKAQEAARRLVTVLANGDNKVIERALEEYPWLEVNDE